MINHYTANKKVRNDDAYSPGGKIGLRPDRATLVYTQRCREAYKGVPVIAGGVEASLRRLAHYDYWSDTVKRSILLDAKADLVVYGMGEANIVAIADRLKAGQTVRDLRDLRGVAFALGAAESPPAEAPVAVWQALLPAVAAPPASHAAGWTPETVVIPTYDQVKTDVVAFAEATRLIHSHTNPFNAATLVQYHDRQAVVQTPPAFPLSQAEMDAIFDLPYTRRPHPSYTQPVPAHEMIKDSVTIMRGCFGGCTFCSHHCAPGADHPKSFAGHRSSRKWTKVAADPDVQRDDLATSGALRRTCIAMRCTRPDVEAKCRRLSCIHPGICKLLGTDHAPTHRTDAEIPRGRPAIRKVLVSSGHPHGSRPAFRPEYVRGTRGAPHRRTVESRTGTHQPGRA